MEEVDMEALVTTLIGNMESQARWTIEELPTVVGDIDLLEQVWSNLLDNAVKFSRNSNPSKINIGCCPSGDEIFFYVRDNGVGFDRLYADKLFGVFQRLNTKFEGTGVGLATVKRGVTRMGGRVFAESEAGKGATIYFSLPVKGNDDKYS
jgi:light-regulated signal transduction histidine kinase (bacteriophytochrome)